MSDKTIICANQACRVAETGKCIEGLELGACPHYGQSIEIDDDENEDESESEVSQSVALQSGAALSSGDAGVMLRRGDSRVIAIIGPRETGKTSLIAGLYDLFQMGEVDGVCFAGSHTLPAFEMACHDARDASRRGVPHMERTRRGEVLFYHLDLCEGDANERVALLLADRSGEEYSDVGDDINAAANLDEIRRADVITILIDGARLLDVGLRHNIKNDVIMILQGLIDADVLRPSQRFALVLTKFDLIRASPNAARAESDFVALHDQLLVTFPHIFADIRLFRIAASPKTDAKMRGQGVDAVLRFWLEPRPQTQSTQTPRPVFSRMFARVAPLEEALGVRHG